jgi:predicted HTH transcriptional regulator
LKEVQAEIEKETRAGHIRDLLSRDVYSRLDKKQVKALRWMLDHPAKMTTRKYCKLNRCSDETARKDFHALLDADLIQKVNEGRSTGYILKQT